MSPLSPHIHPTGLTLIIGRKAPSVLYEHIYDGSDWNLLDSNQIRVPGDWKKINELTAIDGLGGNLHPSFYKSLINDLNLKTFPIIATTTNPLLVDFVEPTRILLAFGNGIIPLTKTDRFNSMSRHASSGEIWMSLVDDGTDSFSD